MSRIKKISLRMEGNLGGCWRRITSVIRSICWGIRRSIIKLFRKGKRRNNKILSRTTSTSILIWKKPPRFKLFSSKLAKKYYDFDHYSHLFKAIELINYIISDIFLRSSCLISCSCYSTLECHTQAQVFARPWTSC